MPLPSPTFKGDSLRDFLNTNGLLDSFVAGWALDSTHQSDSSTVKDIGGKYNLTPTDIVKTVNSFTFNGTTSKALASTGIVLGKDYSIFILFKASAQTKYNALVSQSNAAGDSSVRFSTGANGAASQKMVHYLSGDTTSASDMFDGLWQSAMIVESAGKLKIYFRGNQQEDVYGNMTTYVSGNTLCLGANNAGTGGFLAGDIACVLIFSGPQWKNFYKLHRNLPTLLSHPAGSIVIFGDSIGNGSVASDYAHSWAGLTEVDVNAAGKKQFRLTVGGYTTYAFQPDSYNSAEVDANKCVTYAINTYHPSLIVVELGVNDLASGTPNATIMENYARIKSVCDKYGVDVLFGTPTPADYGEAGIAQAVALRDLILSTYPNNSVDVFTPMENPITHKMKSEYIGSGVHPNDLGHAVMHSVYSPAILARFPSAKTLYPTDDLPLLMYEENLKHIIDVSPADIALSAKSKVAELVLWLKNHPSYLWYKLYDGYIFLENHNNDDGTVMVSLKGNKSLFATNAPTIGATGAVFASASNQGLVTRARMTPNTEFAIVGFCKGGAQTEVSAPVIAQHTAAGANKFHVGGLEAGGNDLAFSFNGTEYSTDNDFFDDTMRSFCVSHSGTRIGMRINGSATEVAGYSTQSAVLTAKFSIGCDNEGVDPAANHFDGSVACLLIFSDDMSSSYAAIHTNVKHILGI